MSEREPMKVSAPKVPARRAAARGAGLSLALAAALSLAGCSSVPDAANPVEWYRGAKNWWSSDSDKDKKEAEKKAAEAKEVPGASKPFPSLDTVPAKPPVSTEAERKAAAQQLAADRDQARYTDQQVRLQTDQRAAPAPRGAAAPPAAPPAMAPSAPAPETKSPMPAPGVAPAPPAPAPQQQASVQPPAMPPSPPPAATITPPPMQAPMAVPVPRGAAGGTAQVPGGGVVFGAPPPDIAAMNGAGAVSGGGYAASPAMPDQPAGYRGTRSPFSPRFPAGVQATHAPPRGVANAEGGMPQTAMAVGGTPLAEVKFGVGSSKIDAAARRVIRDAAAQQKARGGTLYIIGHASSRTRNLSPMRHHLVNFRVSVDRANAVARELLRQGVPVDAIQVTAVSDGEPLYYEVMPAGEAGNRRAVIVLQN